MPMFPCTLLNDRLSKMCSVGDRKNGSTIERKEEREVRKEKGKKEGRKKRRGRKERRRQREREKENLKHTPH